MNKVVRQETPRSDINEISSVGRMGGALFDIGWRLAASVVLFLWGGNWLDKKFQTGRIFTVVGFLLVIGSFVVIVRQILRRIPKEFGGLK